MAISLVSKLFSGKGLQVDKQQSSSTKNVYVPPVQTHGQGHYPYQSPPFFGNWEKPIGMELKKKDQRKEKRKRSFTRVQQSIQSNSSFRGNFVNKALSNFDLFDWVKKLGIKHFRGVFSRDALPKKMRKECGIVNLDDNQGPGKHWVCYKNLENDFVEYFDSLGLVMPNEIYNYLLTS